ncbi:hypothetical protein CAAN1_23S01992 [[Candida] anglica]|uniref:peptidylprolyl isomerase n=1 Tax=[Candida] anglica TaxID=148631 RepID=A0ABP0E9M0_9ASCO
MSSTKRPNGDKEEQLESKKQRLTDEGQASKSLGEKPGDLAQWKNLMSMYIPTDKDQYNESFETNTGGISIIEKNDLESVIVTGSVDGVVTFWSRKNAASKPSTEGSSLCYVKQFTAHPNKQIVQIIFSNDARMATVAQDDHTMKIFDLNTLDMIQVIRLKFNPGVACWAKTDAGETLVVSDGKAVHLVGEDDEDDDLDVSKVSSDTIHRFSIESMAFNRKYNCVVSTDVRGFIEYWVPQAGFPVPNTVKFQYKTDTDLFEMTKNKCRARKFIFSGNMEMFAAACTDGTVRVWDMASGKIQLREPGKCGNSVTYDPSDSLLIFTTDDGMARVVPISSQSEVDQPLIRDDQLHIDQICLLGRTDITSFNIEMVSSENSALQKKLERDPLIVCTGKDSRVYVFGGKKLDPETNRDHTLEETTGNSINATGKLTGMKKTDKSIASAVTLHTTVGDIKIKLFTNQTPKTAENFVLLSKRHYYDNVIFHRVIKKFMIQTGDPLGDGTGGESCWGGHFKDEFSPSLSHSKPFMVSMANAGPGTNGSQFFITTEASPWLDGKHTVFGEVIDGQDTVKAIEAVDTNKDDKPYDPITILSTTVHI